MERRLAPGQPFSNEAVAELIKEYRPIWAIGHALSLMGWDSETYMPPEGVRERAAARAELTVLRQSMLLRPKFIELLERAAKQEGLNDFERGVVRVLEREVRIARAIPPELNAEIARVTQEAMLVWRRARQENDFAKFEPYLSKIVSLTREMADRLGWKEHPYDALIDLYEEGMTARKAAEVLDKLEKGLRPLIDRVVARAPSRHALEEIKYDVKAAEEVNVEVLRLLGYPLGTRARLGVSAHPFTTNMGVDDVRITTRYEGVDFKRTLFSVVHEFGHALYELQIDRDLAMTPIAGGASLGVHESQSRFWENVVGRSRGFAKLVYPVIRERLRFVEPYGPEGLYEYFNVVRPGPIRVDADEVTYNMHIIARFRIELALVGGEVRASDVPELWNDLYEKLLGIRPRNYSEGALQDIHWSMGSIGYFPTYSLGTVLAAQVGRKISAELGIGFDELTRDDLGRIREWLREKIHRWGMTYAPEELIRRALGEGYEPEHFIRYIEDKYLGS
ncbi:MAG: carboxypeptidase M32 [Desulfurococcaceae archaeon]